MSSQIPVPAPPARTAMACLGAFIIPGLGHIILGRWWRGLLLAASITLLFGLGFLMEGHLFKPDKEWLTRTWIWWMCVCRRIDISKW